MTGCHTKAKSFLSGWLSYQGMTGCHIKAKKSSLAYLPTPPLGQDMTQGQFLKRNLTGLNAEFSFS